MFVMAAGRLNPYCEVVVDGQKGNVRTDTKKKTLTPEWDEEFTMYVYVYVGMHAFVGMCVCMHAWICVCVCMYECVYVCDGTELVLYI